MRQLNAGPADGPPSQIFETRTRSQKSCCTAFLKIKITKGSCGPDERFLRKESFGMPQPAAALSITNMMNPHLFFSSLWKLLTGVFLVDLLNLGGGGPATELEQVIRTDMLERKEDRGKAAEKNLHARGQRREPARSTPRRTIGACDLLLLQTAVQNCSFITFFT